MTDEYRVPTPKQIRVWLNAETPRYPLRMRDVTVAGMEDRPETEMLAIDVTPPFECRP